MNKELEVYNYVTDNVNEFLPTILRAITDGITKENKRLKESKAKVECGIVALIDKVKLDKLKTNMRLTLIDALKSCTFMSMESSIKKLEEHQ